MYQGQRGGDFRGGIRGGYRGGSGRGYVKRGGSPSTKLYSRGGTPYQLSARPVSVPRSLLEGLGSHLEDIKLSQSTESTPDAAFEDVESVSSYSWIDGADSPTIAVPGAPPVWLDRTLPYAVPLDRDALVLDNNGDNSPSSPLTPLIVAVQAYCPSFDFTDIDIVTDRKNLRLLTDWLVQEDKHTPSAQSDPLDPSEEDFRIDLQLVDNRALLLTRWEAEKYQRGPFGFSDEFLKASTGYMPGCTPKGTHHRITTTMLGSLKLLVRSLTQACLKDEDESLNAGLLPRAPPENSIDDLVSRTSALGLQNRPTSQKSTTIVVKRTPNTLITEDRIIKMKTRSFKRAHEFDWASALAKVYLSSTAYVVLGIHDGRGTFVQADRRAVHDGTLNRFGERGDDDEDEDVIRSELEEKIQEQEQRVGESSKRLAMFFRQLRDLVIGWSWDLGDGEKPMFSLVRRGAQLSLYRRANEVYLPDELADLFKY